MITMYGNQADFFFKLKANWLHPRDYSTHRQTPWTDNDSSLLFAAPNIARFAQEIWPCPLTLTLKHQ